jgi:(1->4)-alpha-D-glucan 1-alpha-D-glucosylmutase
VFLDGEYVPLQAEGERKDNVVAFARVFENQSVVVVVPRLIVNLLGEKTCVPAGREVWQETAIALPERLAAHRFTNILTRKESERAALTGAAQLMVADALQVLPVAILRGECS